MKLVQKTFQFDSLFGVMTQRFLSQEVALLDNFKWLLPRRLSLWGRRNTRVRKLSEQHVFQNLCNAQRSLQLVDNVQSSSDSMEMRFDNLPKKRKQINQQTNQKTENKRNMKLSARLKWEINLSFNGQRVHKIDLPLMPDFKFFTTRFKLYFLSFDFPSVSTMTI